VKLGAAEWVKEEMMRNRNDTGLPQHISFEESEIFVLFNLQNKAD
jgi:hypothetical protein